MYHNPIKQNPSFYAKSHPSIKLMYVLLLMIPFLSLTHAVTNVRYSVNYKHHKRYWSFFKEESERA